MTSKSDLRGHPGLLCLCVVWNKRFDDDWWGLKLCVHVSVMGYYRFINFHQNRRGRGFSWETSRGMTHILVQAKPVSVLPTSYVFCVKQTVWTMRWIIVLNERLNPALERGADSALPSCFLWISFGVFVRSSWFFQYLPKNKRRTFWCKNWRRVDFWGLFLSPQSQHFRFSPSWCHDGVVLAPPPPASAGWARPVAGGGRPGAGEGGAGRALGGEAAPGQGHG